MRKISGDCEHSLFFGRFIAKKLEFSEGNLCSAMELTIAHVTALACGIENRHVGYSSHE
jgi:hypothetical protein